MTQLQLIQLIYAGLSVFAVVCTTVTNTQVWEVIPAVILLWVCYGFFSVGYGRKKQRLSDKSPVEEVAICGRKGMLDIFLRHRFLVLVICAVCSIMIAYYYTGHTPVSLMSALSSGEGMYQAYQQYSKDNQTAVMSVAKIPFILMNAGLNFLFVASIISCFLKEKMRLKDIGYIVTLILIFWYFGLARGTNFELFEVMCVLIYCVYLRWSRARRKKISPKMKLLIAAAAVFALLMFSFFLEARGFAGTYVTDEIGYDPTKFLPTILPGIAILLTKMTGYFGFGFFYTTALFTRLFPAQPQLVGASMIPFGFQLFGVEINTELARYISTGTNWRPDIVTIIGTVGFVGLFALMYLMGKLYKKTQTDKERGLICHMLGYYVFLQMLSLPIANFILVSSANKICVAICIFLFLLRRKIRWK